MSMGGDNMSRISELVVEGNNLFNSLTMENIGVISKWLGEVQLY